MSEKFYFTFFDKEHMYRYYVDEYDRLISYIFYDYGYDLTSSRRFLIDTMNTFKDEKMLYDQQNPHDVKQYVIVVLVNHRVKNGLKVLIYDLEKDRFDVKTVFFFKERGFNRSYLSHRYSPYLLEIIEQDIQRLLQNNEKGGGVAWHH